MWLITFFLHLKQVLENRKCGLLQLLVPPALVIFVDKELEHIIPVEPVMLGLQGVSKRVWIVLWKFHSNDECCMQIELLDMADGHIISYTQAQAPLSWLHPVKHKFGDEIQKMMSTVELFNQA